MTTPTVPASAMRVSHAEREPVVERLQQAYAEGRLDKAELDLRLHLAMTARTRADLDAVHYALHPPAKRAIAAQATADPLAVQRLLATHAHNHNNKTQNVGPLVMMCTRAIRNPYVRQH